MALKLFFCKTSRYLTISFFCAVVELVLLGQSRAHTVAIHTDLTSLFTPDDIGNAAIASKTAAKALRFNNEEKFIF